MKDNKGFSLVELIIVIAIMAILAAALAPQLMKYIERGRKSTDYNNCQAIKTNINALLAEDDVYEEVVKSGVSYIKFSIDGAAPTNYVGTVSGGKFESGFEDLMNGEWESVKQSGDLVYGVLIEFEDNKIKSVDVDVVARY